MKKFYSFLKRSRYSILILLNVGMFFFCIPEKKIIRETVLLEKNRGSAGVATPVATPVFSNRVSNSLPKLSQPIQSANYTFFTVNDVPMLKVSEGIYYKRGDRTAYGRIEWIGKDYFITDEAKVMLKSDYNGKVENYVVN